MTNRYENIGGNVKERRRQLKIKQEDLASAIGISRTYLSLIESGKAQNISFPIVEKLANELNLQTSELIGENEPEALYIDPALRRFASIDNLPFQHILDLNNFAFRGKKPQTEEEWRKLYNAIKDVLEIEDD